MNTHHILILGSLLLPLTTLASGGHKHADPHAHEAPHSSHISADMAAQMDMQTITAGPGTLHIQRTLNGRIHVDPARVSRVRARYPGLIEAVSAKPWTRVKKGQVLAQVQSNDSLQTYPIKAPIGGWVVTRAAQIGEITGDEPLFVIADLSELWVELDVFDHDLDAVKIGQTVSLYGLHDEKLAQGRIEQLSPLIIHSAQSVRARVVIANPDEQLRPGQYVRGKVTVERKEANLLVPQSALQDDGDARVVYQKVGDEYQPRQVKLGASDGINVEVLDGLEAGARIVSGNSYLIKADLKKSGASHAH